jgi:hypothetical protein
LIVYWPSWDLVSLVNRLILTKTKCCFVKSWLNLQLFCLSSVSCFGLLCVFAGYNKIHVILRCCSHT